jgi:hypothetical protein
MDNEPVARLNSLKPVKNKWRTIAIIFIALALIFVGSGIFFFLNANSLSSELTDVKKKNDDNTKTIKELSSKLAQSDESSTGIAGDSTNEGYLVIREWGIRFKVSSRLTDVRYAIDGDTVHFIGRPIDYDVSYVQNINNSIGEYSLGDIYRSNQSSRTTLDVVIDGKKLGDYYYYTAWSFNSLATGVGVMGGLYGWDGKDASDMRVQAATDAFDLINNEMLWTIELVS